MKVRVLVIFLLCLLVALTVPLSMQGQQISPQQASTVSQTIQQYLSPAGHKMLQTSPAPAAKQVLKAIWNENSTATSFPHAPSAGKFVADPALCGGPFGETANLEPQQDAVPQNEESIDFKNGGGIGGGADLVLEGANDFRGFTTFTFGGVTGFYVHRGPTDNCSVQTEGALPPILGSNGSGDPVDKYDSARDNFFAADLRVSIGGAGLATTSAANLANPAVCPNGTETTAQTPACWPTGIIVDNQGGFFGTAFIDKDDMAVDEASTGAHAGAGDVYVTDTAFGFSGTNNIDLTACSNSLTACNGFAQPPPAAYNNAIVISDPTHDVNPQFSDIDVLPDGTITVTWINVPNFFAFPNQNFEFRYTACTPNAGGAAGGAPSCDAPTTLYTETDPLQFGGILASNTFRIATYPKHVHQVEADGSLLQYIVWDKCKTFPFIDSIGFPVCPDADTYTFSIFGEHFPFPVIAPTAIDATVASDQFFAKARTDATTNDVNIIYHSTAADGTMKHRVQLLQRKIIQAPSAFSPPALTPAATVASGENDIDDEPLNGFFSPLFGDYIGLAARTGPLGTRRYAGFTHNSKPGSYQGILRNQSDNAWSKY